MLLDLFSPRQRILYNLRNRALPFQEGLLNRVNGMTVHSVPGCDAL
ncbi:hypothetical protein Ga0080574_TMP443 (plasmid) [Salipiger abyssi]|uniref:Uncharacterized protein n=1 Tax=Salipiger abyssi TaxID=1250539 RepID=A0A1P8UN26_9RHOB|nr:hypothetical protein Ga0080574_TMP443 [Salipiger abyssi]